MRTYKRYIATLLAALICTGCVPQQTGTPAAALTEMAAPQTVPELPPDIASSLGLLAATAPGLALAIEESCRDDSTGGLDVECVIAVLSSDQDCDGSTLLDEVLAGLDPFSAFDGPDRDCDGIPNEEDLDIDGDGIPNETDPDVDGDLIRNDDDPDVDNDGILNGADFDVDGDGLLNRWDIDDDADGTPDDEDDDDAPEECGPKAVASNEDDGDDTEAEDDSSNNNNEPSEEDLSSALSLTNRLMEIGKAGADKCNRPSQRDRASALRQAGRAAGGGNADVVLELRLEDLEEMSADRSEDTSEDESESEALDVLIDSLDESLADTEDDGEALSELEDRLDAVEVLFSIDKEANPVAELAEVANILADNDSDLNVVEQAEIVAAIAEEQPDGSLEVWSINTLALIERVEDAGINTDVAATLIVPFLGSIGAFDDDDLFDAVITATAATANQTGSSIGSVLEVIDTLNLFLNDKSGASFTASASNTLQAANERGVDPVDVLVQIDLMGGNLSDGVSEDEADDAADAVAMQNNDPMP